MCTLPTKILSRVYLRTLLVLFKWSCSRTLSGARAKSQKRHVCGKKDVCTRCRRRENKYNFPPSLNCSYVSFFDCTQPNALLKSARLQRQTRNFWKNISCWNRSATKRQEKNFFQIFKGTFACGIGQKFYVKTYL